MAALLLAGCGYHVVGHSSSLPAQWKAIAVPAFVNRTTHYRIEQRFTEAVIREFLARTSYKIVQNVDAADGTAARRSVEHRDQPDFIRCENRASDAMLVTVHAKVELVSREDQKVVFKNEDMVFREEYQISGDIVSFFEEQNPALERMSREFAARVVGDVVEGF